MRWPCGSLQPLADAVQGYLECIFGRGATIRITWNPTSGEFDELEVVRDPAGLGTFEFKALSGGTREQVGVAMRLAMAQVLAADHDGCLPVVLDDAFANSDPDRIAALQRMLYLAARNGLQIIVLTCTPRDYHGLGATEVGLRPPAAARHPGRSGRLRYRVGRTRVGAQPGAPLAGIGVYVTAPRCGLESFVLSRSMKAAVLRR